MDASTNQYIGKTGVIWKFLAAARTKEDFDNICRVQGVELGSQNCYCHCIEKRRYKMGRGGYDCPYRIHLVRPAEDGTNSMQTAVSPKCYGSVYYRDRGEHCHPVEQQSL